MLYEIKNRFSLSDIRELNGPVISLYQTTHRSYPENKQNIIVYKNLLREVRESLERNKDQDFIDLIMKPLIMLEKDRSFWDNVLQGVAILCSKDSCLIYHLHIPVQSMVFVANSFHIKPLLQAFQSMSEYHVLGLSRNHFSLYQGNRNGFTKINMDPKLDMTRDAVLGKQHTDAYFSQGSFGGVGNPTIHISNTDKKEAYDQDTEKYFRFIDRYILENLSKKTEYPLILVSVKEHHALFKEISHNPYLMNQVIDANYESLDMIELKERVTEIIDELDVQKMNSLINTYENLMSDHKSSSDLYEVLLAAKQGKIDTLMVEIDRIIMGHEADQNNLKSEDILDDLAELVLKDHGKVWMIPKDKMPSLTGVAAIYRYE